MRKLTGLIYRTLIKRILFLFPADHVHEYFLRTGKMLGKSGVIRSVLRGMWRHEDSSLAQNVRGMHFANPMGLSAGFDYNGDLVELLSDIGFGFHTIGTLTIEAYEGNTPPMLGRLPRSRSLLVNKGFKNLGIEQVLEGVSRGAHSAPRGVSIGATNKPYPDFASMVANIVSGFRAAEKYSIFDYYELNISCPNLQNIQNLKPQLASPLGLSQLLAALAALNISRPVFIKMPLERTDAEVEALIEVAVPYAFITGLIFANLAKDRTNPAFDPEEIAQAGKGNFSGKPTAEGANHLLRFAYRRYGKRFVLIGVGGVFTPEDAYEKILCGATLVQMITGMIYMGPQQIGVINEGLNTLLQKDGYRNIADAIGTRS